MIVHAGSVVLATGGAAAFSGGICILGTLPATDTQWPGGPRRMSNMEFIQAGIGVVAPFINLFGNYLWEANPQIETQQGSLCWKNTFRPK